MPHQDNVVQAREIDKVSTVLIDFGVNVVKKNPIKVGFYVVGILLCFLFNGFQVNEDIKYRYETEIENVDYRGLEIAKLSMLEARHRYHSSRGWFYACDEFCLKKKAKFDIQEREYRLLEAEQRDQVLTAHC